MEFYNNATALRLMGGDGVILCYNNVIAPRLALLNYELCQNISKKIVRFILFLTFILSIKNIWHLICK
jgi:hypothetical protein